MPNLEITTIDVNQDKSISKEELEGVLAMIEDDEEIKQLADILTENMDEYNFPVFEEVNKKYESGLTEQEQEILELYGKNLDLQIASLTENIGYHFDYIDNNLISSLMSDI